MTNTRALLGIAAVVLALLTAGAGTAARLKTAVGKAEDLEPHAVGYQLAHRRARLAQAPLAIPNVLRGPWPQRARLVYYGLDIPIASGDQHDPHAAAAGVHALHDTARPECFVVWMWRDDE